MKQIICFLLAGILMLSMSACVQEEEPEFIDPVQFYFLRIQDADNLHHGGTDSVIAPETREANGHRNDLTYLLEQYLSGTATEGLGSPFPPETALIGWEFSGTTLILTLSEQFAELTGMDLTLACACLTMTCLELTDAEAIQITAETATLDTKASITMDRSTLVLIDDSYIIMEPTEN